MRSLAANVSGWKPTESYLKIAEANRQFYSHTAECYDSSETCVTDPKSQQQLEADLDRVLGTFGRPLTDLVALDACGGSGNISLKLLHRGVNVILADISPDLLSRFREKAIAAGFQQQSVCAEIATYLGGAGPAFDLIVFSSALHHLENIEAVLTLAFQRLAPGGLLFTVFDPAARSRQSLITRALLRADYYWFKATRQAFDLVPAIGRRVRRVLSGSRPDRKPLVRLDASTAGMLAEYHVETGIDDLALVAMLKKVGYEVVWHERFAKCRAPWINSIVNRLGDVTSFKLLLRRPANR